MDLAALVVEFAAARAAMMTDGGRADRQAVSLRYAAAVQALEQAAALHLR